MRRKELMFGVLLLSVLGLVGSASGATILQGDVGTLLGCSGEEGIKPGWTLITSPDCAYRGCEYIPDCFSCWKEPHPYGVLIEDVNGTGIDIHIDAGNHINLEGRDRACDASIPWTMDPLAVDYFMVDDVQTPEDAAILLTFTNLSAGNYTLIAYHNNPATANPSDEDPEDCVARAIEEMRLLESVTVSGAVSSWVGDCNVPVPGLCRDSDFSFDMGMSQVEFAATGEGDVVITYMVAPLNAFELILTEPEPCNCLGDLAGTDGFSDPDGTVDTGDMAKLLSELITGGGDAGNNYKVQNPSAELLLCGDLAATDGFSAPDSQIDTGDMAKLLSHLITSGDPGNNYEADCIVLP